METKFSEDFEERAKERQRFYRSNETPLPLRRELPAPAEFPIAALGEILGPAANVLHQTIQAPSGLCGQSVLAAATLVAQPYADLEIDGRVRPLSETFVTVGESGERKSAVDKEALAPVREKQREIWRKYQDEIASYESDFEVYRQIRAEIVAKNKKNGREAVKDALEKLGDAPKKPFFPLILSEDPTYEGLVKTLQIGQPSMGLFSDEGGQFIGGHGMSQEHQLKTAAGLSKLWDAGEVARVRAGEDPFLMHGKRLSTHLMLQPIVASQFFDNPVLGGQGFLARYLPTFPISTIGSRMYQAADLNKNSAIDSYRRRLSGILSLEMPLKEKYSNELNPPLLRILPKAKELWIKFHDEVERGMGGDGPYRDICAFGSKASEHVLRLAGTLTLVRDINAREIASLEIDCAVELLRYYIGEVLRLRQLSTSAPEIAHAELLYAWLRNLSSPFIHLAQIYQFGPAPFREAAYARKIMKILEEHGWIVREAPMELEGSMRRDVWYVKPVDANSANFRTFVAN